MKIAVVGSGIFGCTVALKLQQLGSIDLFDEKSNIMQCASYCNQYRLHSGYHYPRSLETAQSSLQSIRSFAEEYGSCLDLDWNEHYYAIAKDGSFVNSDQYLQFLHQCDLSYEIVDNDLIDPDKLQLLIKVNEKSFNYRLLKELASKRLYDSKVKLNLNIRFDPININDYDLVINATYANINYLLPDNDRIDYQFELCEKPIVLLNKEFDRKSFVIMDGPFMCIDPYMQNSGAFWSPKYSDAHVMGHVEHAIHHRNVGKFPEIPDGYDGYIDSNMMYNRPNTNIEKFISSAKDFFPSIKIQHIGSMYTIRTVLPNRDHDDARPSYITKHSDKLYSVFSGKIGTCVDIANKLVKIITDEKD